MIREKWLDQPPVTYPLWSLAYKVDMQNAITIQLTQGQITIIDAEYAHLVDVKWCALKDHSGRFYAVRGMWNGERIIQHKLHRVIMSLVLGRELERHVQVDHINMDTLDNRACNLRLATKSQNQMNRGKQRNNTSGFKGVTWDKRKKKWMVRIGIHGVSHYLGYFDDPYEAYLAYCAKAKELHGEFANPG